MHGINIGRWLAGGIVAAIVFFVLEGILGAPFRDRAMAALSQHGLVTDRRAMIICGIIYSLVTGLVLVFFYAAARTRFGPGVGTAVTVALALFAGSMLLALLDFHTQGLYPDDLLVWDGIRGLVEFVVASIAGAWVYKEGAAASTAV
jgi:hypothetical protein